ncbi:MAG TPA: AAA family ATPase [Fimbriimonadales bacterium]|nr:AAA family ATPase [Fimbriimonadales bacterium]
MPIWAVVNQKGGVGKTTTAVNVSAVLASNGHRTLLVDVDPQGNSTTGLGTDKRSLKATLFEVLVEGTPASEAIHSTSVLNLHILPSTLDLAGAEPLLLGTVGRETLLRDALKPVQEDYEYIFLDAPPSLGILTILTLAASNFALIPMQCEFYALEGLSQLLKTIELVKKRINPDLEIGKVLLTMYDKRNRLSVQVEEEVRSFFSDLVAKTTIPRNVRLSEAPSFGQPAVIRYPSALGSKAYRDFVEEFCQSNVMEEVGA